MSRIALTSGDVARKHFRRKYVPVGTTVAAAMISLLPVVASAPYIPDFAFIVLIGWRLLRPELWTPTSALGLGLFNDLVAGHPIGQSMAIWTLTFLLLDFIESRAVFRDFWMDWLLASLLILFHTFAAWTIGRMMGGHSAFAVLWPQYALSVLSYPIIARGIVLLDRWRLSR